MSIQPFGQFILSKTGTPGVLGELAQAAAKDPRFPRNGKPNEVWARLYAEEASVEFHEALEEAMAEWSSLR